MGNILASDLPPNNALDRTPESIAALRGKGPGGAGQGKRYAAATAS